ncbi:hypothetical protein [Paenibacillus luteus]|uniref:hypothetical protein n=1 Tax=Paenibacillus luteus TaxID=2545753 RepID=UPI001141354A|nr:hypothetical protein [Paenibacillus luteus]
MKKRNWALLAGTIVLLFALSRWNAFTHLTSAQVTVIAVHEHDIEIQDLSGQRSTVRIPDGISKLIEADKSYWIKYEHREWEKPTLVSIEP